MWGSSDVVRTKSSRRPRFSGAKVQQLFGAMRDTALYGTILHDIARYCTILHNTSTHKFAFLQLLQLLQLLHLGYVAKLYKNIITYGYIFLYYISGKWKVGDLQSAITANFAKNNAP